MALAASRPARMAAEPAPFLWTRGRTAHGARASAGAPSTWQRVSSACPITAPLGVLRHDRQPVDPRVAGAQPFDQVRLLGRGKSGEVDFANRVDVVSDLWASCPPMVMSGPFRDGLQGFLFGLAVAPPDDLAVPPPHRMPEGVDDRRRAAGAVSPAADAAERRVSEVAHFLYLDL